MIYLAHNFAAREWLRDEVKPFFEQNGVEVASFWIEGVQDDPVQDAVRDLEDIDKSSVVLFFMGQFGKTPGRGKYFELGYALRAGKRVVLIGDDSFMGECVFYHLPNLFRAKDYKEAMKYV